MDRLAPLLPSAIDPAMASSSSLASYNEDGGRRSSGSSLVARPPRMSNATRQKSVQQVLHAYKHDNQLSAGPLRRKASTAPTAWPRDQPSSGSSINKSKRDSLEMSLGERPSHSLPQHRMIKVYDLRCMEYGRYKETAPRYLLLTRQISPFSDTDPLKSERRPQRKRESHVPHYTLTVPFNANTSSMLESPTDRRNGESGSPFVLPPGNTSTVTPTKPAATSFFSSMFSNNSAGSPVPRTPSSTSPARPSTVRRLARTLLEWNLGPQTDLTRWQRDSPRASRDMTKVADNLLEDSPMRSPD